MKTPTLLVLPPVPVVPPPARAHERGERIDAHLDHRIDAHLDHCGERLDHRREGRR